MKKFVILLSIFLLFGCTSSVPPQDEVAKQVEEEVHAVGSDQNPSPAPTPAPPAAPNPAPAPAPSSADKKINLCEMGIPDSGIAESIKDAGCDPDQVPSDASTQAEGTLFSLYDFYCPDESSEGKLNEILDELAQKETARKANLKKMMVDAGEVDTTVLINAAQDGVTNHYVLCPDQQLSLTVCPDNICPGNTGSDGICVNDHFHGNALGIATQQQIESEMLDLSGGFDISTLKDPGGDCGWRGGIFIFDTVLKTK